ncbi:quinoprotein dehydrogenase-associated SoxYZ-like carrier [Salipiger mucosus]|uniref:Sulfur oxidation protein SoxZ n=1 Tax=Salipiger mucosus DSM 16094 TaxID=1123237 RepID=S9Q478_9RHOB|nr:quinoprotein dehydrogenase-associated SoxYZ-like carrier [Salipiger mucosus]EPX76111.1 hypothetical protein Salmuc_00764 [Salipiger mucosus DSM 16094]
MIRAAIATTLLLAAAPPLQAGETWDALKRELYGDRVLVTGRTVLSVDAPYRTYEDARTHVSARVTAPEGTRIGEVTVVLDENPMPVSAVFALKQPQARFAFDVTLRINGPTPLHVVAETTDGRLFVSESFVKTSGQGACAAPPGTDPEKALATLGDMVLSVGGPLPRATATERLAGLADRLRRLDVDISHPSHSGMQMDQVSLLFIPMRYVETVEIDTDGAGYVEMTGSISLSENPALKLSVPGDTGHLGVTMTDTDGTVSTAETRIAGY